MNETSRRQAHLVTVAQNRRRLRDARITSRLAELIERGIDPAEGNNSPYSVLVGGGVVSRATYYRHKSDWTWAHLLEELLPAHRPLAAAALSRLRDPDSSRGAQAGSSLIARIAPFIAATTPASDEQDLRVALEGTLAAAQLDLRGFMDEREMQIGEPWTLLSATGSSLVALLGECRPLHEEDWTGAANVASQLYEFAARPDVRALGLAAPDFSSIDQPWAYSLVRAGTRPVNAVRTVRDARAAAMPDAGIGRDYDCDLWVAAARATIDRHGQERALRRITLAERRELDGDALREVENCTWRAAPSLRGGSGQLPLSDASNISDVLLSALQWDWAIENPQMKSFGDALVRATDDGKQLKYGMRSVESIAFAWATWTLIDRTSAETDMRSAADTLLRFALRKCQDVGREIGGTLVTLIDLPAVIPRYLHLAARKCSDEPSASAELSSLLERVTSASATTAWSRLPRAHRDAWRDFIREAPDALRLRRISPSTRSLTKSLDSLENAFARGARVEREDIVALMESAGRIAQLTSWAASADWSAPLDTSSRSDVGTPFTIPPNSPPSDSEKLRQQVQQIVDLALSHSLARDGLRRLQSLPSVTQTDASPGSSR